MTWWLSEAYSLYVRVFRAVTRKTQTIFVLFQIFLLRVYRLLLLGNSLLPEEACTFGSCFPCVFSCFPIYHACLLLTCYTAEHTCNSVWRMTNTTYFRAFATTKKQKEYVRLKISSWTRIYPLCCGPSMIFLENNSSTNKQESTVYFISPHILQLEIHIYIYIFSSLRLENIQHSYSSGECNCYNTTSSGSWPVYPVPYASLSGRQSFANDVEGTNHHRTNVCWCCGRYGSVWMNLDVLFSLSPITWLQTFAYNAEGTVRRREICEDRAAHVASQSSNRAIEQSCMQCTSRVCIARYHPSTDACRAHASELHRWMCGLLW